MFGAYWNYDCLNSFCIINRSYNIYFSDSFERNIVVRITDHGKEELSIHSPCPTETTTFLKMTEQGEDVIMYDGNIPRPKQTKYYYRNSSVVFRNLSIEDSGTHIWECENFEKNTFNVFIIDEGIVAYDNSLFFVCLICYIFLPNIIYRLHRCTHMTCGHS